MCPSLWLLDIINGVHFSGLYVERRISAHCLCNKCICHFRTPVEASYARQGLFSQCSLFNSDKECDGDLSNSCFFI